MKKQALLVALLIFLISGLPIMAQEEETHDILDITIFGGATEPWGGISSWHNNLNADFGYNFGFEIGYFFNEYLIGGFGFDYTSFGIKVPQSLPEAEGLDHRLFTPTLFLKYIVTTESNFEPFFKVFAGVENPKFTTFVYNPSQNRLRSISYSPGFAYGLSAGLFYFTSDYSGLFIEAKYHLANTSGSSKEYLGTDYIFDKNLAKTDLNFGIRLLIGGGD